MRYLYLCEECKGELEIEKGMSDPHPEKCPKCNTVAPKFHQVFGSFH